MCASARGGAPTAEPRWVPALRRFPVARISCSSATHASLPCSCVHAAPSTASCPRTCESTTPAHQHPPWLPCSRVRCHDPLHVTARSGQPMKGRSAGHPHMTTSVCSRQELIPDNLPVGNPEAPQARHPVDSRCKGGCSRQCSTPAPPKTPTNRLTISTLLHAPARRRRRRSGRRCSRRCAGGGGGWGGSPGSSAPRGPAAPGR